MNNCLIFSFPDDKILATSITKKLNLTPGNIELREFPDGECYVRIDSDVNQKTIVIICTLDHPNKKILSLLFSAQTMKVLGAKKICLVAPYLPFMRQDKRFKPGEAVTATLFANFLSSFIDYLITVDPHLHRIHHLTDIFAIPVKTMHATKQIAEWIHQHVSLPYIIGPDEESRQWVSEVANSIHAPYDIIKKIRHGDRDVSISMPDINNDNHIPVLVDDIISTGTSMLAAIQQLTAHGFKHPVCIAVHALFDKNAYVDLHHAGAQEIVTCNTIPHATNKIDISDILIEGIKELLVM